MKHYNIPVFVPHLGCPHDCVFCSQKSITGTDGSITEEKTREIIDDYIKNINPKGYTEIAFFGGSFTGIDHSLRHALLKTAKEYIDKGVADGIRLSTRPDYIDSEILDELKEFGVTAIELGVQSLDDEVLRASGRGHDRDCVIKSAELIKKYGFELGLQMMTGLPCDTPQKSVDTAKAIASLKPDTVRVYPTLVIRSTALHKMMSDGDYIPWELDTTIDVLADVRQIFDNAGIRIIRMGLQTTDEICPGAAVVGGPFHEAIGELAQNRVFLRKLVDVVEGINDETVCISCNKSDVSKIIGHKRCNAEEIYKKYKKKLKLYPEDNIPEGELRLLR